MKTMEKIQRAALAVSAKIVKGNDGPVAASDGWPPICPTWIAHQPVRPTIDRGCTLEIKEEANKD